MNTRKLWSKLFLSAVLPLSFHLTGLADEHPMGIRLAPPMTGAVPTPPGGGSTVAPKVTPRPSVLSPGASGPGRGDQCDSMAESREPTYQGDDDPLGAAVPLDRKAVMRCHGDVHRADSITSFGPCHTPR